MCGICYVSYCTVYTPKLNLQKIACLTTDHSQCTCTTHKESNSMSQEIIKWSEWHLKSPERLGGETNDIKEQVFKVIRSP